MQILPYRNIQIITKATPEQICTALRCETEPRPSKIWKNKSERLFWGKINVFDFFITPQTTSERDVLPEIMGRIQEKDDKSVIDIRMQLSVLDQYILKVGFFAACVFFVISLLSFLFATEKMNIIFAFYPLFLFLLIYTVISLVFLFKVKEAEENLRRILER